MTATSAFTPDSDIDRIFGAVVQPRTYRHLLYLLLSFPLGILSFVTVIAGVSLGIGLSILVIGLVVLAVTLALARVFGCLERKIAIALLGATFESRAPRPPGWRATLTDPRAWSALLYMLLRFPLGVTSFVAALIFLASIPVMAASLLFTIFPVFLEGTVITSSEDALLVSLFGCVIFLMSAHVVNGLAAISRRLAVALL